MKRFDNTMPDVAVRPVGDDVDMVEHPPHAANVPHVFSAFFFCAIHLTVPVGISSRLP